MKTGLKTVIACSLIAFAAGCAQPEPEPAPVVVQPEPVYDKYGNPV